MFTAVTTHSKLVKEWNNKGGRFGDFFFIFIFLLD